MRATTNQKGTQGTIQPIQTLQKPQMLQKTPLFQRVLRFRKPLLLQMSLETQKHQMLSLPQEVQDQHTTRKPHRSCRNHKSQSCQRGNQIIQTILQRRFPPNPKHQKHRQRYLTQRQSSQRNRRSLGRAVIMRRMKTITAMITAEASMTEKAMGPMMMRKMMTGTRTMMMLRREV